MKCGMRDAVNLGHCLSSISFVSCFLLFQLLATKKKIAFNSWTITKKERKNTVVSDAEAFRAIVDNDFSEISLDIVETEVL